MTNPLERHLGIPQSNQVEKIDSIDLQSLVEGTEGDITYLDSFGLEKGLASGAINHANLLEEFGIRLSYVEQMIERERAAQSGPSPTDESLQLLFKQRLERFEAMQDANPEYLLEANMDFRVYGTEREKLANDFVEYLKAREARAPGSRDPHGKYKDEITPLDEELQMLFETRSLNFDGHPRSYGGETVVDFIPNYPKLFTKVQLRGIAPTEEGSFVLGGIFNTGSPEDWRPRDGKIAADIDLLSYVHMANYFKGAGYTILFRIGSGNTTGSYEDYRSYFAR